MIPTKITTFLALILTLKNFIFDSKFYIQIKGFAMGTRCAPTYGNIFKKEFEEKYIHHFIKNTPILYLRFIDDILKIWTKSENENNIFMKDLNTKHPFMKTDFKYLKDKIEFLGTLVYIEQHQNLQKTLNQNPTDSQNY